MRLWALFASALKFHAPWPPHPETPLNNQARATSEPADPRKPKRYVYSDFGYFKAVKKLSNGTHTTLPAIFETQKLPSVTYIVISTIVEVQNAPKPYVYRDFRDLTYPEAPKRYAYIYIYIYIYIDFGDFIFPKSARTLSIYNDLCDRGWPWAPSPRAANPLLPGCLGAPLASEIHCMQPPA